MINKLDNINDLNVISESELRNLFDDINFENVVEQDKNADICINCNSDEFLIEDFKNGIEVCTQCGEVVRTLMDGASTAKHFEDSSDKDAKGNASLVNKLLPQSSLGTMMGNGCYGRLKTIQAWSRVPYKERSLNNVFKIIIEKCEK